jgi:hypothetical protein
MIYYAKFKVNSKQVIFLVLDFITEHLLTSRGPPVLRGTQFRKHCATNLQNVKENMLIRSEHCEDQVMKPTHKKSRDAIG